MYKVSVVIPVYNAASCLDNTIHSIINQSIGFENIELILVDDNSTDDSKKIILDYSEKYNNIVYFFSKKNHGFPGFGRNKGVDISSSEYILFLDNDDTLDSEMCENMYNAIHNTGCDVVCCDIKEIDEVSEEIHKVCSKRYDEEFIISYGDDIFDYDTGLVWNKIFRKSIIEKFGIKFITNNYCDDQAFSIEYMIRCNSLGYLNNYAGYNWIRRNESLSNSKDLKNLESLFMGYDYMVNFLIGNNKSNLIPIVSNSGTLYLLIQSTLLKSKDDKKKFLNLLYKFEEKCGFNVHLNNPFFSVINFFVIKKRFNFALLLLSFFSKLSSVSFIKKIYRKVHNK